MNALASRRRHPAAIVVLLLLGLIVTGGLFSLLAPKPAGASVATVDAIDEGKKLFLANCATCHGLGGLGGLAGPSLFGVGAASADFQVGTGRMPPPAAGPIQAPRRGDRKFTELFKVNCAMCHNFAGSGGALSRGKFAPSLRDVSGKHIYEAMTTGPQSMPVFNDTNLTPQDKNDIISYLHELDEDQNPGGMNLGNLGPVSEGLFIWVFGLGVMIAAAVWLGAKAA